ncbi:MAG: hypothetical protein JOZ74_14170 [Bradyrhizobium sp.]|nr:hypothetical protein [Bradyrhizobium sp.]
MSERKDREEHPVSRHGVNDPVRGVDVKSRVRDNRSAHEGAQWGADVRAEASPDPTEEFLPEALRRAPAPPLNKRTGRHRSE